MMRSPLKHKLAIGAAAIAAAAFAGGAYAAVSQSGATSRQAFLNDIAKRLNVTPKQLTNALQGAYDDQLQAAVAAGRLTQAQAQALKQRIQQRGAPLGFGGLRRFGAPGAFAGPNHAILGGRGGRLAVAATYLGLSDAQLFNQLASGKSLAQIASARGKSVDGLKAAMTAAVKAKLDKAVAAKLLTRAQEQKVLAKLPSLLDSEVNLRMTAPAFGPRGGFQRHFGMRIYPGWAGGSRPPATSSIPSPPAPPSPVY